MSWYDPKDASSAIEAGWYNAVIEAVEAKHSDKVGAMQKVAFRVYGSREVVVYEYFHAKSLWKYKALAKAFGKAVEFNAGQFDAADFINANIDVELIVKDSPEYGEQNNIAAFAPDGERSEGPKAKPQGSQGFVPSSPISKGTDIDLSDVQF